jgi:hypothetical protein
MLPRRRPLRTTPTPRSLHSGDDPLLGASFQVAEELRQGRATQMVTGRTVPTVVSGASQRICRANTGSDSPALSTIVGRRVSTGSSYSRSACSPTAFDWT